MRRFVNAAARTATACGVGAIVLAIARWPPLFAEPPWDVRAMPLAGAVVVLAAVAALSGRERRPARIRSLALALGIAAALLALAVALRPPAGLAATVDGPHGRLRDLPRGPIDVIGRDLGVEPVRKWTLRWSGALNVPASGAYRLWATGRGTLEVSVDGRAVLRGEGDPLHAGAGVPLTRGAHALEVVLHRVGPGPRLRLGWTRPDGTDEAIPPRFLGEPVAAWRWTLVDLLALAVALLAGALVHRLPWDAPRAVPLPRAFSLAETGWSLLGHAVVVAVMSWPLVTNLAGHGVVDRPDGRLNAWILAWDAHALWREPTRLFQAPIFHPLPDALAFSENLVLPAAAALPALLLGGPVLGYNLVLLASLVLSGLGAQRLVRRASGDRFAAFVGGAFFAAGAHRWVRLAHLHAQVTVFLPLALLALDAFHERRTWRRALLVGLMVALQGLSSVYLGAITATAVVVAVLVGLVPTANGPAFRARDLVRLAGGALLAAALLAPIARPYFRMRAHQGVEFGLADVATYATTLESYAASGMPLFGPLTQRHLDPERVQDTLFPGLTVLVCGIAGLARAPRRFGVVALAASVAAIVLSLGPETALYRVLHENVVLVRGVRALSRFSLVPVLALCVLSGFALAGRWRLALFALATFTIESSNMPIRYAPAPPPSETARWLRGREGAIVYLPLGERDTEVMLDAVAHHRPLVNGDSGFMPRPYSRAMELLQLPINEDALRLLRAIDVRHVVTRTDEALPVVARFGEERIYAVPPGDAAARPAPAAAGGATAWSTAGVTVDLGVPRDVRRIVFEVGEGEWIADPWVAVSDDGRHWRTLAGQASLGDAVLDLMADPRHGRGEVRIAATRARWVRLDPRVPARPPFIRIE